MHPFEKAGLGRAPFKFRGMFEDRGPRRMMLNGIECTVGSPGQPMGSCAYCGQGIALCCQIESADGKRFIVGSDCVRKVYSGTQVGNLYGERTRMQHDVDAAMHKHAAGLRAAKDDAVRAELDALLAGDALAGLSWTGWGGRTEDAREYLRRVLAMCGAAGRKRYLGEARKLLHRAGRM